MSIHTSAPPAATQSAAERLDAADGTIDGKYFGRRILEATPVRTSSATALDAADGVIDGRYYGRRIIDGGSSTVSSAIVPYSGSRVIPTRYVHDDAVVDGRTYYSGYAGRRYLDGRGYYPAYGAARYYDSVYDSDRYVQPYGRRVIEPAATVSARSVYDSDYYADGRYYSGVGRVVDAGPRYVPATTYAGRRSFVGADYAPVTRYADDYYGRLEGGTRVIHDGGRVLRSGSYTPYSTSTVVGGYGRRYAGEPYDYYGDRVIRSSDYYGPRVVRRTLDGEVITGGSVVGTRIVN